MKAQASRRASGAGFALVLAGSVLIALGSYRYLIPGNYGLAPPILANHFTRLGALTVHAGFAATALLIGPLQFYQPLRRNRPGLHRLIGRLYVFSCLVAGLAGMLLAFGAATGPISTLGFGLLAALWLCFTLKAWRLAVQRRFLAHERWMLRSFALTFAAVTLRLYLPFAFLSPWGYDNTYRAISFLCWVPNLLIMEWLLSARLRTSPSPV